MKLGKPILLYIAKWTSTAYAVDLGLFARSQPSPSPISVPPSQNWDGNDGPWSSFTLQIGFPAQDVRVLVSPATDDTLVVSSAGCVGSSDSKCIDDRGRTFNPNSSTTWQQHGYYQLSVEPTLGAGIQAVYGNDTVTLGIQGSGGPTLQDQIVAAYVSTDLYVGMFGLNPSSTNFTSTDLNRPSYLSSLKTSNIIPSLSFGYTAGNQYRLKQVYGSLTLGGYDSSLFMPNDISIPLAPGPGRQLLAGLQKVHMKNQNGTEAVLMADGIMVSMDPTVAELWLPAAVCTHFQNAFGLTQDPQTHLYLVNNDMHTQLVAQNASVTFTLGSSVSGGPTVDIVLPYASFDLVLKPPALGLTQSSKYFPLRQAANDSQYTIGRTFFQEAYLTVDWERQNFSVAQCVFSQSSQQKLVAIASASSSSGSGTVGIAVGVAVGVVVLIAAAIAAYFLIRRRRRRQTGVAAKAREDPSEKIRQGFAKGELDTGHDNQRYEMAGSDPNQAKLTDDRDIPGWVNEKANYPGHLKGMVEADGGPGGSGRAELGGPIMAPRGTVRPLHEMHDPSSQPRFELPAESPRELHGSTPSSSAPASPVSSTRRSAGGLSGAAAAPGAGGGRGLPSPFSKATSPLSGQSSGSPHPSGPLDGGRLGQPPTSAGPSSSGPSRSSFLGFGRLGGGNRSSTASKERRDPRHSPRQAPRASQPSSSSGNNDGPMIPSSSLSRLSSPRNNPAASATASASASSPRYAAAANRGGHDPGPADAAFSPVSRRGTFERSGTPSSPHPDTSDIRSPISPQSPDSDRHQGLWGRLTRS